MLQCVVLIFLDAIDYPQLENKNFKLLLNFTSRVFLTNEAKDC